MSATAETFPGTRVPRDVEARWAALRYEQTRRGDTVDAVTGAWHTWGPDDARWSELNPMLGMLREDDVSGALGELRGAVVRLADLVDQILGDREQVEVCVLTEAIAVGRSVEAAVLGALREWHDALTAARGDR